jgi:hypothetical protein
MIKVSTFFKNRVSSAELIFRNADNKGVNLIYFPELGNSGINFINLYRKKGYWDYVIIPMTFAFLSHKIYTNNYYREFKKKIPQVKIQRRFIKNNIDLKSIVVDLTPLSENFAAFSKSRSKKQTMEALFKIIEQFGQDSKITGKEIYLLIDGQNQEEKEIVETLFYYSRLQGNKLRIKNINGIILRGGNRYWPLTIEERDKDGKYFKINLNMLTRYLKEVHGEDVEEEQETPEEAIQNTQRVVRALYDVHRKKIESSSTAMGGTIQKADNIEENPVELIKNEVERNPYIKGKTFEEKLSNLFRTKPKDISKEDAKKVQAEDKAVQKIVKDITEELKKLNKKYNGVVEVSSETIQRNTKTFYDPIRIVGYKEFHAYDKQKNEFGDNLDQAIFDLIKSIETYKDLGIKVQSVKTVITDNNRDRFKTYKIKLKQKFGHTKPYTVSFHVPIPSKGKYLKLGGNDYIMINQFFPKPVIKVSPKMVRVYTQYSTAALHIKHHAINDAEGIKDLMHNFGLMLKKTKKLKKAPEILDNEKIQEIIDKYELPENINTDIFANIEIKA